MEFSDVFSPVLGGLLIQTSVGTAADLGAWRRSVRVDAIGGIENGLALFEDERGSVVVDHGRREQT